MGKGLLVITGGASGIGLACAFGSLGATRGAGVNVNVNVNV